MGRPRLHLTLSWADERRLKELWKTTRDQPLQEPRAQRRLQAKLVAGDFRAAGQMSRWLEQGLGFRRKPSSLYPRLKKCGAVLRVPRPVHFKKWRHYRRVRCLGL